MSRLHREIIGGGRVMERLTYKEFEGTECEPYVYGGIEYYGDSYGGEVINKLAAYEDAEEQGLLLKLPCAIGSEVWGWEYPTRIDKEDGSTWTICDIRRAKVVPKKFNVFMLDKMGESYFTTQEAAEQALAKQKGE